MEISITLIIVIVTVLVSIGGFSNQRIQNDLIFYPPAVSQQKQWYRFFGHGLIHADFAHLLFNMFALYMFGELSEAYFVEFLGKSGKLIYLGMYITALPVAILSTFFQHRNNKYYYSLGASGAVSAVVFSAMLLQPGMGVGFLFLPFRIPAFIFGPLYLLISAYLAKRGQDNINHSAHIWGAVYGLVFTFVVMQLIVGFDVVRNFLESVQEYMS
jgi:membrane associated rhomboid family serine protease